jgi:predicted TPR repeat methyltransferase
MLFTFWADQLCRPYPILSKDRNKPVTKRKDIHERVLNASSLEELMTAYGEWAAQYDDDLLGEMGYVAPIIASNLLKDSLVDKEARILDAGCGTGIVGGLLHEHGYRHIEGLDYSRPMLVQAETKNIYQDLHQGDLMNALEIADHVYDAIISVGTFTCGHVGPAAFDELVRITRPGGYICFTVREEAWEKDDYHTKIDAIADRGLWDLQESVTADYIRQEGALCKVLLYQTSI